MKKLRIFTLASFVLLITVMLFAGSASANTRRVYDTVGKLSAESRLELENKLEEAEAECGVAIRVYIGNEFSPSEKSLLRAIGMTDSSDLILLSIECWSNEYFYELFAYGDGDKFLSYDASDAILDSDSVYNNIKSGKVLAGAISFAEMSADGVNEGRKASWTVTVVVSVIVALIVGGAIAGTNVYRYKRKLKSRIYPVTDYATLELNHSSDNFIGSSVTRTRVQSSSSRGGGGGGGGGSRGRR